MGKLEFRPFQHKALAEIRNSFRYLGGAVLGLPTSGGKTAISLAATYPRNGWTLVLVTKTSIFKWGDEVKKWTAYLNSYVGGYAPKVITIDSRLSVKERDAIIQDVITRVRRGEQGIIVITNYATLQNIAKTVEEKVQVGEKTKKVYRWSRLPLVNFPPEYLVVDEAHKMKNPNTVLSKFVHNIPARHTLLLTATPTNKMPSDYWALFYAVSEKFRKQFPSFWKFADRYEIRGSTPFAPHAFIAPKNEKELIDLYSTSPKLMVRYDRADILPDLPPVVVNPVRVPMEKEQESIYKKILKGAAIKDETGKWVWSGNDQWIRLVQTATVPSSIRNMGGVPAKLPRKSGKFEYIADVVETRDAPLVVYARFKESLNELQTYLIEQDPSLRIVRITGDEDERERRDAYTAINKGLADVALLTDAGGEAIELTGANHIIFMQMPSSYTQLVQIRDRLHRIGQTHSSINVTFLLSKGTVDEHIYEQIRQGGTFNHRILLATMKGETQ